MFIRSGRFSERPQSILQRQRSWCISTDVGFTAKAADIVDLYLDPPENPIVLCVDEKPNIQALERKTGYIETENRKDRKGLSEHLQKAWRSESVRSPGSGHWPRSRPGHQTEEEG